MGKLVRRGPDNSPEWWITADYSPLAKKKSVIDMRCITKFDIRPSFKFRPQGQIKSDHDSLVVWLNLGQNP